MPIGREAEVNLVLNGLPAEIGDATPLDRRYTHILVEPGKSTAYSLQDIDPEMVAIKLSTNLDLFAVLLQYRVNIDRGIQQALTYGNKRFSYSGREEITLNGLARLYRTLGSGGYFNMYLYPGMVPCLLQSFTWSNTEMNEVGFMGSVNIDKKVSCA